MKVLFATGIEKWILGTGIGLYWIGLNRLYMVKLIIQLVDRVFSKSYLTEKFLSGERRVQFEKDLRETIRNHDKVWIDKEASVLCSGLGSVPPVSGSGPL